MTDTSQPTVDAVLAPDELGLGSDVWEQVARDRATVEALRAYLESRGGTGRMSGVASPVPAARRTAVVSGPVAVASADAVRTARRHVRDACVEHGVDEGRQHVAELVVSELLGNALRHGRQPVTWRLAVEEDDVLVGVTDGDPHGPAEPVAPSLDAEGGRGLPLVGALSRDWGWRPVGTGKQVWARL